MDKIILTYSLPYPQSRDAIASKNHHFFLRQIKGSKVKGTIQGRDKIGAFPEFSCSYMATIVPIFQNVLIDGSTL